MGSTGYGYDDRGRETLDAVFAQVMGAEDALVRHNFVCGTHALTVALFGVLRPGDVMLSVTGKPYDTLQSVIGLTGDGNGTLQEFGIEYREVALNEQGRPDLPAIRAAVKQGVKMVYIQRSRGYSLRPSLRVEEIEEIARAAKEVDPHCIVMVDNCYGEFVQEEEPTSRGADLMAGSLIKNPGGGIAPMGGYVAGRQDLVERAAERLTVPGIGGECGATLESNRLLFQGFFFAPHTVSQALKTASFCAAMLEKLGYVTFPGARERRSDIIQTIRLESAENLVRFCQGIQYGSPVDSYAAPVPAPMPGYESEVVMAAGTFIQGASLELSCDGPLREPYLGFMQGGLTYEAGKYGVLCALQRILGC